MKLRRLLKPFAFLGAIFLIVISRRKLFFTPGVIGHNWDWQIPFLPEQSLHALKTSLFAWNQSRFGFANSSRLYYFLLYPLGIALNGAISSKILVLLILLVSFFSSYLLLRHILRKFLGSRRALPAFIGAFFYVFNPFVFNDLIAGATIYLLGYAIFPLSLYFFFKIFEARNFWGYLLGLLLSYFVLAGSHWWIFSLGIFLLTFLVFFRGQYKRYLLVTLLSLLSLSSVFLSIGYQFAGLKSAVVAGAFGNKDNFAEAFKTMPQTLDKVLVGASFGDRHLFLNFLGAYQPVFWLAAYAVLLSSLGMLLLRFKEFKDRRVFVWVVVGFFGSLALVTGGRPPLGNIFIWLMEHVVYFRIFRTIFHFFGPLNLFYSVLIAVSLALRRRRATLFNAVVFTALVLANLPVFLAGDNGIGVLKNQERDSLDVYQVNPEFLQVLSEYDRDPQSYRTLFVPVTSSPVYRETDYQRRGQGGDPEILFSPKPTVSYEFNLLGRNRALVEEIEEDIVSSGPLNQKLLGLLSFRELLFKKDIWPSFTPAKWFYNYAALEEKLSLLPQKLTSEFLNRYAIDEEYFLPLIYVSQKIIYSQGGVRDLSEITSFDDYEVRSGVFFDTDQGGEKIPGADEAFLIAEREYPPPLSFRDRLVWPEAAVLPDSKFYPLVLAKEKVKEMLTRDWFDKADLLLWLATKRVVELENLAGVSREASAPRLISSYKAKIEQLLGILGSVEETERGERFWHSVAKSLAYLAGNEKKLGVPVEEHQAFRDWVETLYSPRCGEYCYFIENPREGVYQVLLEKKGISDLEDFELSRASLRLEDVILDSGKERADGWLDLGKHFFPTGKSYLPLEFGGSFKNLVNPDDWDKKSAVSLIAEDIGFHEGSFFSVYPGDSGEDQVSTSRIDEVLEEEVYYQEVSHWKPGLQYKLAFDYRVEGGGLGVAVVEKRPSSDEAISGEVGGSVSYFESRVVASWVVDPESDEALEGGYHRFEVGLGASGGAREAQVLVHPVTGGWVVPTFDIKNASLEVVLEPRVFLKAAGDREAGAVVPAIKFIRVNPTKYRVQVRGAQNPYLLIFSESFDERWQVYRGRGEYSYGADVAQFFGGEVREGEHQMNFWDGDSLETWGGKSLAGNNHFVANGYANSWYITPEDVGGAEDYDLILQFQPQQLVYLGIGIQILTLVGVLGCWGLSRVRTSIKTLI